MKRRIHESKKNIPVVDSCDVAVVGGGIAGVAAALATRSAGGNILEIGKNTLRALLRRQGVILSGTCDNGEKHD